MSHARRILVVAQDTALASTLLGWLGRSNYELAIVTTFAAAKVHLKTLPDLLITEVKLGEYNGLHLVLRGRADGIPAIVIGEPDRVFEGQALQLGAAYVALDTLEADDLTALVEASDRASFVEPPQARTPWMHDHNLSESSSADEHTWHFALGGRQMVIH